MYDETIQMSYWTWMTRETMLEANYTTDTTKSNSKK